MSFHTAHTIPVLGTIATPAQEHIGPSSVPTLLHNLSAEDRAIIAFELAKLHNVATRFCMYEMLERVGALPAIE